MVETNIRRVRYGMGLYLDVRRVQMTMSDNAADLREKICSQLRRQYSLAAVPVANTNEPELYVAKFSPFSRLDLKGPNWQVTLREVGGTRLRFTHPGDALLMAKLFERQIQIQLTKNTNMWTLDSPRIWYEAEPFETEDGIAAFNRYHISVIPLEEEGLGITTHISTAFFTVKTVADFFDPDLPSPEQQRWQSLFNKLRMRQQGQQGTLLYDLGQSKSKCYFKEFVPGVTCANMPLRINGTSYDSLYDYYTRERPYAEVSGDALVARVSFWGIDRPVPVAAHLLRLRVMNNALPKNLKQIDKIPPETRVRLIGDFQSSIGEELFNKGFERNLWQPPASKVEHLKMPALLFGRGAELSPPADETVSAYQDYYHDRLVILDEFGCYYVPPTVERQISVAYPNQVGEEIVDKFTEGMMERLCRWTGKPLQSEKLPYASIPEAIDKLKAKGTGMVAFVFDDLDPATYYFLSVELKNWRIKRLTSSKLLSRYSKSSFIDMNTLDVLQQLGCVPWTLATPLNYQAQLAIDVGVDHRYFAVSLLICRSTSYQTNFWLDTLICPKSDHRRETIEPDLLRDKIIELYEPLLRRRVDPLETVLVLRDGRERGEEGQAIREAQVELMRRGILTANARLDIVDFAKRSLKEVRLWEHVEPEPANVLEGKALLVDKRTVILATTGVATLNQGTAIPLVLTAPDEDINMRAVAHDVNASAQLNWSSPGVAQREPLPIRRTDQVLNTRREQEIRGLH